MLNKPIRIIESEKVPEVIARVQPDSTNSGSKKTPKLNDAPQAISMIMKQAKTTI